MGALGLAARKGRDACRGVSARSLWPRVSFDVSTYVPCLLRAFTDAEARRVAAGREDQPVLSGGWAGSGVHSQDLPPVLQRKRVLDGSGDLGCGAVLGSLNGRGWDGGNRRGHGSSCLGEEALDLVENGHLLLGHSKRRQGEEDG